MNCPACDDKLRVVDSRHRGPSLIRRRRLCRQCGEYFLTYETFKQSTPRAITSISRFGAKNPIAPVGSNSDTVRVLSTLTAIEIGRRGGEARSRNLSPERRSEIATWAHFIRRQKERGAVPLTEQMQRTIQLVRVENPDLAAFLKVTSRMPMKYSERLVQVLSSEEKQVIERAWQAAVFEGNK